MRCTSDALRAEYGCYQLTSRFDEGGSTGSPRPNCNIILHGVHDVGALVGTDGAWVHHLVPPTASRVKTLGRNLIELPGLA